MLTGTTQRHLLRVYRTGDDFRRYSWQDEKRRRALIALFRRYRKYFGHRVLDLGCGGGVLGLVADHAGLSYVGVDGNPDMIRDARTWARRRGSKARFLQGDLGTFRLSGQYDTITILGNTMGHLTVDQFDRLLERLSHHVGSGGSLLIDYRDLVAMFWNGTWTHAKVQTFVRGRVTHRTRLVNLRSGRLEMSARPSSGRWRLRWSHAIWSPFILESVMRSRGWRLVKRVVSRPSGHGRQPPEAYLDVYRRGSGARRS